MSRRPSIIRLLVATTSSLALAACSDSTAPSGASRVSLSFASAASAGTTAGSSSSNASVIVVGTDTLRLSRVRLVLDEIELYQSGVAGCGGGSVQISAQLDVAASRSSSSSSDDDCGELETGPFLVDLGVDGSLTAPIDVSIPAGSYSKLELKLRPVSASSSSDAGFRAAHPELAGASVIVDGTFRGQPFTYRTSLEAEHELYFQPPLVVSGGTRVTVSIDVGRWFRTSAGAIIDPSTAAPGGPFAGIVAANIAASFEAYEDRDRDGRHDDDGPNHS